MNGALTISPGEQQGGVCPPCLKFGGQQIQHRNTTAQNKRCWPKEPTGAAP